jgi:hypothetical protein
MLEEDRNVMKRIILALLVTTVCMVGFASPAPAVSPEQASSPAFKTPKGAAYCYTEPTGVGPLMCWTPNDGFMVYMTVNGKVKKQYEIPGSAPAGYRTLRFGHRARANGFRCHSRRTGLTCKNRRGHGWWLGRYVGYRLF